MVGTPPPEAITPPEAAPSSWRSEPSYLSALPGQVQWSAAWPALIVGGLLAALSMAIPFPTLGVGLMAGGYLCVGLYRRRARPLFLTFNMGARLGAAAGGAGFAVFAVLTGLGTLIFVKDAEVREMVIKTWQEWAARNPGLQIDQLLQYARSPEEFARMAMVSLAIALPIFLLMCGVGGVIAAAVLGKRPQR